MRVRRNGRRAELVGDDGEVEYGVIYCGQTDAEVVRMARDPRSVDVDEFLDRVAAHYDGVDDELAALARSPFARRMEHEGHTARVLRADAEAARRLRKATDAARRDAP